MAAKLSARIIKPAFTWLAAIGSFALLTGVIVIAIELFKFQKSVANANTVAGVLLMVIGLAMIYFTLCYEALQQLESATGPIVICSNCLNIMIGVSLVIVAHVLPLSIMFAFLAHMRTIGSDGKETYSINPSTNWTMDPILVDLEYSIELRITTFGIILMVLGSAGVFLPSVIMVRLFAKKQREKKEAAERRKVSQSNHVIPRFESNTWKAIHYLKRGSVYDYTAWESRSQDLYSDKPKIVEESSTFSRDGQFTNDLISDNRLSSEFDSAPFAKASTLVKGARRFTDSLLPSSKSTIRKLKLRGQMELNCVSGNCELDNLTHSQNETINSTSVKFRQHARSDDDSYSL